MYKRDWQMDMVNKLKILDDFTMDFLTLSDEAAVFLENNNLDLLLLKDEIAKKINNVLISEDKKKILKIVSETKLINHIYNFNFEKESVLIQYNKFTNNYFDILSNQYHVANSIFSDNLKKAFGYLYDDLLETQIFNNIYAEKNKFIKKEIRNIIGGSQTCPYCDVYELEDENSSIDHFLPKSKFPILSIFSKNLIVSCAACNDRIKGQNIYLPICHPEADNIETMFKFKIDLINKVINIEINKSLKQKDKRKIENFIKLFKLDQRYNKYGYKKIDSLYVKISDRVKRNIENKINDGLEKVADEDTIKKYLVEEIEYNKSIIMKQRLVNSYSKLYLDYLNTLLNEKSHLGYISRKIKLEISLKKNNY